MLAAKSGRLVAVKPSGRSPEPRAATRWAEALGAWAIPPEILAKATASPWGFPPGILERRADRSRGLDTPSTRMAREALPDRGSVLDVGCGPGAASLPLTDRASALTGVDTDPQALKEFRTRAEAAGVQVTTIEGRWPDVAERAPVVDVTVCNHVAYNVPDLARFALGLTEKTRARVVLELTLVHPRAHLNHLWMHFHGLPRPSGPTADDAVDVLEEAGLEIHREDWTAAEPSTWFPSIEEAVAWTARALCLNHDRQDELRALVEPDLLRTDGTVAELPRPRATVWWRGGAAP